VGFRDVAVRWTHRDTPASALHRAGSMANRRRKVARAVRVPALGARSRRRTRRRVASRGRADFARARLELGQVRRDARRATTNLYRAGEQVVEAGGAGMAAARNVGQAATEAGRSAIGLGSSMLALPKAVRETARRGCRAIERRAARAIVSALDTGTRVLKTATRYVDDLSPRRRRVRRLRSVRRRRSR